MIYCETYISILFIQNIFLLKVIKELSKILTSISINITWNNIPNWSKILKITNAISSVNFNSSQSLFDVVTVTPKFEYSLNPSSRYELGILKNCDYYNATELIGSSCCWNKIIWPTGKKSIFNAIQVDKIETDTPGFVFIHNYSWNAFHLIKYIKALVMACSPTPMAALALTFPAGYFWRDDPPPPMASPLSLCQI